MDVVTRAWTREERDLWHRLQGHAFETPDIDLDFTRRLARTLGWTREAARAAIEEYRRFCFLACVTPGLPVTPSEEVDEVWHLHLTYSRDYWDRWCAERLGRKLHHDPTAGGPAEQSRYRLQYAETLALYESYFGPPPAAFWPSTQKRFATRTRWRMVDSERAVVLPRPTLPSLRGLRVPGLAALLALVTTPASAELTNPLDLHGPDFLLLYCVLVGVAVILTLIGRTFVLATGRAADTRGLTALEVAFITGGAARAADTLYLALAEAGAAKHTMNRLTIGPAPSPLPAELEAYRRELQGTNFRKTFIEKFADSGPARAMQAALIRRNLLLDESRRTLLNLINTVPVFAVFTLGVVKIFVGLGRGKPVGFLVALCIITIVVLAIAYHRERYRTSEGKTAFDAYRERHDRAARAPRAEELALAFAFGGATVLAGTPHEPYGKQVQPATADGSGSSGCGSGSGCGGGGGGGGCGGCGS